MADNVNIIVQDTINDIVVNAAVVVETIDINVQAAVDEVQIIANPNNYVVNINRIIGEQVQSDWTQTDNQAPDYIKNKPTIPAAQVNSDWDATSGVAEILNKPIIPTNTSDLVNDGENGVDPFITLEDIPAVTGFVPYTGATDDVNLGTHDLTATQGTFATSGNPDTLTVNHSSGSGKALTITKGGAGEGIYVNKTSGSGNAVTIVGDLEATNLKRTGGTSSQFLKADGSIDSNTYTPTTRTISTSAPLSGGGDLSANRTLSITQAATAADGYLSSTDWNTFNGKQDALVSGTNIKTINGASVLGSGDLVVGGTNIYNADGTLTSARTLTSGGFPLTFTGSNTASGAIARGLNLTHTLAAAANSDVLVGLDIAPTFTNGAFTGVNTFGLRLNKSVTTAPATFTNTNDILLRNSALATSNSLVSHSPAIFYNGNTYNGIANVPISFRQYLQAGLGGGNTVGILTFEGSYNNATYAQIASIRTGSASGSNQFRVTGNTNTIGSVPANAAAFIAGNTSAGLAINNYGNGAAEIQSHNYTSISNLPLIINRQGGNVLINSTTDAGFRLDVNGTARVSGQMSVNGYTISSPASGTIKIGTNPNTTGTNVTAFGQGAITTNAYTNSAAFGESSLGIGTGAGNRVVGVGYLAGYSNSGSFNTYLGGFCGWYQTTGTNNVFVGDKAGELINSGAILAIANSSIFLGQGTRALADNQTNQIVIGQNAIGAGSNTATLGNASIVDTILRGRINLQQYATGSRPTYVKGALIYDSTLGKLVVGGATGWEVVTSV